MATPCLIGLDAGTREVRAGAFALDGSLLALARRPTPTARPREVSMRSARARARMRAPCAHASGR